MKEKKKADAVKKINTYIYYSKMTLDILYKNLYNYAIIRKYVFNLIVLTLKERV